MVESIAKVRNIRVTPQKARRIVDVIRGKQAAEALAVLKFAPQAASEPVAKLVASAMANARVTADKNGVLRNYLIDSSDDVFWRYSRVAAFSAWLFWHFSVWCPIK